MKPISRRQFFNHLMRKTALVGVSMSAAESLVNQFIHLSAHKALAATPMDLASEMTYIHLTTPGAPPRWYFDLLLNPRNLTNEFSAGGFGNWLVKENSQTNFVNQYFKKTMDGQDYHLPPIWQQEVLGRKFQDLLPNMLMIRGMDMEINSHGISNGRQIAPIVSGLSLSGLMADMSNKPMPSVNGSGEAARSFKSAKQLSYIAIPDSENPLLEILKPFAPVKSTINFRSPSAIPAQMAALDALDAYAVDEKIVTAKALRSSLDKTYELLDSNIYDLTSQWSDKFTKYQSLMQSAMSYEQMSAIFSQPLPVDGTKPFHRLSDEDGYAVASDLRDAFRSTSRSPSIKRMAENFALAEIFILNNLTSTMTLDLPEIENLTVNGKAYFLRHDQHSVGVVPSILFTMAFYRSYLACLSEFVATLKSQNRFNRTLIHLASDFNRNPEIDGAGSDHGVEGSCTSLLSGMFNSFSLIGNIQVNETTTSRYKGTWGIAAPYDLAGNNRPIQVNDVAATIAALLKLPTAGLITNGRALVNPLTMVPYKREAKNV